jgi:hypothetical protein
MLLVHVLAGAMELVTRSLRRPVHSCERRPVAGRGEVP